MLNLFFSVVSGSEVPSLVDSDEREKLHSSCHRIASVLFHITVSFTIFFRLTCNFFLDQTPAEVDVEIPPRRQDITLILRHRKFSQGYFKLWIDNLAVKNKTNCILKFLNF